MTENNKNPFAKKPGSGVNPFTAALNSERTPETPAEKTARRLAGVRQDTVRITFLLPKEFKKRLKKEAFERDTTQSRIVENAINQYLS